MISIGERLKRLRASKGWNQKDLAAAMGITQSALSSIESPDPKQFPTMERLFQICNILDYEPWKILIDDPGLVKGFMPDWITQRDLDMLYIINTQLDTETRDHFYHLQKEQLEYLIKLKKTIAVPSTVNEDSTPSGD